MFPCPLQLGTGRRERFPTPDLINIGWRDRFPTPKLSCTGRRDRVPSPVHYCTGRRDRCPSRMHVSTGQGDWVPLPCALQQWAEGLRSAPLCTIAHHRGTGFPPLWTTSPGRETGPPPPPCAIAQGGGKGSPALSKSALCGGTSARGLTGHGLGSKAWPLGLDRLDRVFRIDV